MANFFFEKLALEGAYLITGLNSIDERGGFTKNFEQTIYELSGIKFHVTESFITESTKNVIRGMHFQTNAPQAKLVTVLNGKIYDVLVDLRKDSKTFGQWQGYELSKENHRSLLIPRGFAHGFLAMEDNSIVLYQCDGAYDKETDTGIRYDDSDIDIVWPIEKGESIILSDRDLGLMSFKEYCNTCVK